MIRLTQTALYHLKMDPPKQYGVTVLQPCDMSVDVALEHCDIVYESVHLFRVLKTRAADKVSPAWWRFMGSIGTLLLPGCTKVATLCGWNICYPKSCPMFEL